MCQIVFTDRKEKVVITRSGRPPARQEEPDHVQAPQVGATDLEQHASPILDCLTADDTPSLDAELESGACYFNDLSSLIGTYIRSGHELLQCNKRGVWSKVDEED